ncbi:unnamed protein product [Arabidopsis halleri]
MIEEKTPWFGRVWEIDERNSICTVLFEEGNTKDQGLHQSIYKAEKLAAKSKNNESIQEVTASVHAWFTLCKYKVGLTLIPNMFVGIIGEAENI